MSAARIANIRAARPWEHQSSVALRLLHTLLGPV